ncbi:pyruvate dehydrogenase kinase, putative [Toxoplasma gondii ME49]|uniref:Protein-serine/threonine kinase n=1 Tax=Toxoplasma gondii (strain ATCC 50611 / Me49) TaxID=508771 RepID=S8EUE1_TOXGM|nr:pyruvate dehydrogenase kinase, putative [Toxoplasma gondii ME49]EPT24588.1 pyruvate dehydrogenase kinase, putative [Toxoplasma gondii ME49]|eukprot:XP_002370720.2 pyruvate dehydrogenase kinase, putative [Toxoplasma gondii ME49]
MARIPAMFWSSSAPPRSHFDKKPEGLLRRLSVETSLLSSLPRSSLSHSCLVPLSRCALSCLSSRMRLRLCLSDSSGAAAYAALPRSPPGPLPGSSLLRALPSVPALASASSAPGVLAPSSCSSPLLFPREKKCDTTQMRAVGTGRGQQIVLSKERHDQLLMAEITEFAMRPCRPLTLQEIAYLKGPRTPPRETAAPSLEAPLASSESISPPSSSSPPSSPSSSSSSSPSSSSAFTGAGEGYSVELFLSVELPVRFASRIKQIEAVPLFHQEQLIIQVRQLYVESFKQLRMCAWRNKEEFRKLLKDLKRRHAPIAPLLVTGLRNLKKRFPDIFTDEFVDDFLDGFFLSRIGTEMLTSAYLSPSGIVDTDCDPMQVIKKAAGDAEKLCHYHYGCCPRVLIWNNERERFACVPQYLYYILFELFKNAMRATVERFGADSSSRRSRSSAFDEEAGKSFSGVRTSRGSVGNAFSLKREEDYEYDSSFLFYGRPPQYETKLADSDMQLPPIQLVVSGDNRVIAIKMSDQGGGVAQESIDKIWSYMYTTARPVEIGLGQSPPTVTVPDETPSPPTVGSLDAAPPTIPGAVGDSRRSGETGPVWDAGATDAPAVGGNTRQLCSGSRAPSLEKPLRKLDTEEGSPSEGLGMTETDIRSRGDTHPTPAVGASSPPTGAGSNGPSTPQVSPLAGFGCGLPLSRLYASYLGGRLEILSLPFHGSDAYLYLNRVGDKERMPPNSFPHGVTQMIRGELRTQEELELLGLPRD